jgi:GTP-binding protein
MRFIDEAKIRVIGGKGGNGVVSWRREKFVPRGGPYGGNGGNGGAVILCADTSSNTLLDLALNPLLKAESGGDGESNNCEGRTADNLIRKVPPGTQVFLGDKLVADLASPGATWVAARGGRGGKGNTFFKTATNQAPDYAQQGEEGEQFKFRLVLKSVADVGLVGFPNAGKSSLISVISEAHPLIANYPFTTITPNLGVVSLDEQRRFVVADIPGLIEGAHEGKGLGINFLKHIERTTVLTHLVDISEDNALLIAEPEEITDELILETTEKQIACIESELKHFSEEVFLYPRIILFSKIDLPIQERAFEIYKNLKKNKGKVIVSASTVTRDGLEELKDLLYSMVQKKKYEKLEK